MSTSKPGSQPPPRPPGRWRRWHIGRWLLLIILAALGYGTWWQYEFRKAIKEASAPGLVWTYNDPIDAIGKDWRAAFKLGTWQNRERCLWICSDKALAHVLDHDLITRLRPHFIHLFRCDSLENFQQIGRLDGVRELEVYDCLKLRGFDGISGSSLASVDVATCPALRSLDALKNVSSLKEVTYWFSPHLQPGDIDALQKALPATAVREYQVPAVRSGNYTIVSGLSFGLPFLRPKPRGASFLVPTRPNPFPLEQFGDNRFPFETVGEIPALDETGLDLNSPARLFPRSPSEKQSELKVEQGLFK